MRVIRNTLSTVDKNLYLGFNALTGSAVKLYSEGNIATMTVTGNKVGIGLNYVPVTNRLEVGGEASKSVPGSWVANSDSRLKKNMLQLNGEEVLEKLLQLKGITYEWNDDKTGYERPTGIQYGFTAQNIQEVFPSMVKTDNLGYLQTAYGNYDPMFIEAFRAMNNKIKALEEKEKTMISQEKRIADLEAQVRVLLDKK